MNVSRPIRAVIPSLDGPVLEVLAGTTRPLTVADVARLTGRGSLVGIRRILERLGAEGVVEVDRRANAVYYTGNRSHLAWPAVELLTGLRAAMLRMLEDEVSTLPVAPVHASLFGSAARRDGDEESDIDLLLVKPALDVDGEEAWAAQLDVLRAHVRAATGNGCQTFDVSMERLGEHVAADDPLVAAWLADGIILSGRPLSELIETIGEDVRA